MIIARKPDWQMRLQDYVASVAREKFKPGKHDCALFAAGGVEAMTGVNLYSKFGKYKTLAAGLEILKASGYEDHIDLARKTFEEIAPAYLQPGDIAAVDGDFDNALAIVQGSQLYVIKPQTGLGFVSLLNAKFGFRVPYAVNK